VVIPVGIGSIVGTALGVLPALALSVRMSGPFDPLLPFAPLWGQLAVLAFATPLFIGVGAWGTAGGRRWAPQRAPIG
jgi:hypothetical protein